MATQKQINFLNSMLSQLEQVNEGQEHLWLVELLKTAEITSKLISYVRENLMNRYDVAQIIEDYMVENFMERYAEKFGLFDKAMIEIDRINANEVYTEKELVTEENVETILRKHDLIYQSGTIEIRIFFTGLFYKVEVYESGKRIHGVRNLKSQPVLGAVDLAKFRLTVKLTSKQHLAKI